MYSILLEAVYIPGKIKMKKALIPPMTLMTSLMSGTNMAMSRVTAIHNTVRTILQRLSNEWVTIPRRRLWTRSTRFRMTDLYTYRLHVRCYQYRLKQHRFSCYSPPQQQNDGIYGDNRYSKEQPGNDHDHIVPWVWHQNVGGNVSTECQEAVNTCGQDRKRGCEEQLQWVERSRGEDWGSELTG